MVSSSIFNFILVITSLPFIFGETSANMVVDQMLALVTELKTGEHSKINCKESIPTSLERITSELNEVKKDLEMCFSTKPWEQQDSQHDSDLEFLRASLQASALRARTRGCLVDADGGLGARNRASGRWSSTRTPAPSGSSACA